MKCYNLFQFGLVLFAVISLSHIQNSIAIGDLTVVEERSERLGMTTIYRLQITPAAESVPAFKYRLTTEPHKTIPGNAITHYLRSLGENSLDSPWDGARAKFGMDVFQWYSSETKSADVPVDKLREASGFFDSYVDNHLRRATSCRDCDWGLATEDLRGKETIGFLLPSIQQTRSMARVLMLRNRLAVIDGRYDDSVDHLRMTYQLGQDVSTLPHLVAGLVAIAEVAMANEGMLHLIAAKDSPNMYWALSELPRPIVSVREGMRLESSFPLRCFPVLIGVETAKHSPEQWSELLTEVFLSMEDAEKAFGGGGQKADPAAKLRANLSASAVGLAAYPGAKKRLIAAGMDKAKVNEMAVAQVVMIDAARDIQTASHDTEKVYYLPATEAKKHQREVENDIRSKASIERPGYLIADMLLPAAAQVRQAEIRVRTEMDALIAIEAIRDHVATTGKLPAKLSDTRLPVRANTFTGQPFPYRVVGKTAVLEIVGGYNKKQFEISVGME